MKKFLFAVMAAALLLSCQNETDVLQKENAVEIIVKAPFETELSRSFFDDDSKAEQWENKITDLSIYAFLKDGNFILHRIFTPEELISRRVSLAIPAEHFGKTLSFYGLANRDSFDIFDKTSDLGYLTEKKLGEYNGAFDIVAKSNNRTQGFIMSGESSVKLEDKGTAINVPIELKRTVAKIAVRTKLADDFFSRYNGKVKINSVELSKAATQTTIISLNDYNTGSMNTRLVQFPGINGNYYDNLFYIYENGEIQPGEKIMLKISGEYDADGNPSTVNDISELEYVIELEGSGNGKIDRNGYYRIAVTINGLSGEEASSSVTVSDWNGKFDQDINLGS